MIYCMYLLKTPGNKTKEVFDILKTVVLQTQYKPGCSISNIWQNESDPDTILLQEEWESTDHLTSHMESAIYKRLLVAMEMCQQKPEVRIIDYDQEKGFDWIKNKLLENYLSPKKAKVRS